MADNSSTMRPVVRDIPLIKYEAVKVVAASFAAMQAASVLIKTDHVPIAYYLAGPMILVAIACILIAKSVPEELDTLAKLLDQVAIFLAVTSLFFSFSIFLPRFISVKVLYWVAYLVLLIIIVSCCYWEFNHRYEAPFSASNPGTPISGFNSGAPISCSDPEAPNSGSNSGTSVSGFNPESPISFSNSETSISCSNPESPISGLNFETPISGSNLGAPVSGSNPKAPISGSNPGLPFLEPTSRDTFGSVTQ